MKRQLPVYSTLSRYFVVYVFAILLSTSHCSPPNFAGSSVDSGGAHAPHPPRDGSPTRRIVKTLIHGGIRPEKFVSQLEAHNLCKEYGEMLPEVNSREDLKKLRIEHSFSAQTTSGYFWLGHKYSEGKGWTNLSPSPSPNRFLNGPPFSEKGIANSSVKSCPESMVDCCLVYSTTKRQASDDDRIMMMDCNQPSPFVVCTHQIEEDEEPAPPPPIDFGPLQERVEALERALKTPSNNGSFVQNQPISTGIIISICVATSFIIYLIFFAAFMIYQKRGKKCSSITTTNYHQAKTAPPED